MTVAINYTSTCPICGLSDLKTVYFFEQFAVKKCKNCHNSWRTNMYNLEIINEMYCQEDYDQHPFFQSQMEELDSQTGIRYKNYELALKKVEAQIPVGKLLDVASGSGAFLRIAEQRGWEVAGVEISSALCQVSKQISNATIYNSAFENTALPPNYFDLITFWDIIEHVIDPVQVIEKARTLLKPGGLILFCTPNEDSLLANVGQLLYKATAARYSYPALALHPRYHTYFFSRNSLAALLKKQNFEVLLSYSQQAFFEHSPLASNLQKGAISLIEKVGGLFDSCYECVIVAKK